ncbi:hypothetical protein BDW68DRAFT_176867 [Aspergillus falconensis]
MVDRGDRVRCYGHPTRWPTTGGLRTKSFKALFGVPIEALCEVSNADVYFTPERGLGMGSCILISSDSYISITLTRMSALVRYLLRRHPIILLFFVEESNYHRAATTSATPAISSNNRSNAPSLTGPSTTSDVEKNETKKNILQKVKLFRREDLQSKVPVTVTVLRPLLFFSFPFVMFSGFMCGSTLRLFNVLTSTASLTLSNEPYNFSASIVGLSYVLCLISVVIRPLGDKFILWQARRNNGIMEPEQRPWLYTALLLLPGSLLPWSVGAAHEVHWFGLVFAMGALTASLTIGCGLPIRYCIDCYKDLSADAIVPVILIRNTMVFA